VPAERRPEEPGAVATLPRTAAPPKPSAAARKRSLARRAVAVISLVDRVPGVVWAKRIIVLPIGERFALISLTAALGSPRLTFIALLVWGGIAALYAVPGRVLRSVAR
jgi:hypothetical protein